MQGQGHVVVVGGGIAGLTAAAFAANDGARVTLLERSAEAGGRAGTQERDGFLLNLGPHALYRKGAGASVLRELGVELSGHMPRIGGYAFTRGERYPLPVGLRSMVASKALGFRAKLDFARGTRRSQKADTASLQETTIAAWLGATFRNEEARQVQAALFRVSNYANAPEIQSAGAALDQLRLGGAGVLYVDGGWQTMVDGLAATAWDAGASLQTGVRVTAVTPRPGGGWSVAMADRLALEADSVVVALPPREAARLVGGPAAAAIKRWAWEAVPVHAATLDVALTSLPNPQGTFALGFDVPLYLSVHTNWAKLGPEGMAMVSLARYQEPGVDHDAAADEAELERFLVVIQPGWRERVIFQRFLPEMTVVHATVTARGGGLAGRPGPDVPGAEGLFVAGDWVGSTGMLSDGAFASGKAAGMLASGIATAAAPSATLQLAG